MDEQEPELKRSKSTRKNTPEEIVSSLKAKKLKSKKTRKEKSRKRRSSMDDQEGSLFGDGGEDNNSESPPAPSSGASLTLSAGKSGMKKVSSFGSFLKSGNRNPGQERFDQILAGMSCEDDSEVLINVQELCNMLLHAANEEALRGLDPGRFVPALLRLLDYEHNGEIMLLAVRCLCQMMEAIPPCVPLIISTQGVKQLCQKLIMISYVDVAEECIKALHRLAVEAPGPVLRDGGMMAVLAYLDFFALAVQRKAVEAAALMVRGANADAREQVEGCLQNLTNLLEYPDSIIVSKAVDAFCVLAEAWRIDEKLCDVICHNGSTVDSLMRIFSNGPGDSAQTQLTWTRVARTFSILSQGTPEGCLRPLLEQGLASVFPSLYPASRALDGPVAVMELIGFACEMFPPLPADALPTNMQAFSFKIRKGIKQSGEPDVPPPDKRAQVLSQPHLLSNVLSAVAPVFLKAYSESVDKTVRTRAISGLARAIFASTSQDLEEGLAEVSLSAFLASILRETSPESIHTQCLSIGIASHVMKHLPKIFGRFLRREGVPFAAESLTERLQTLVKNGAELDIFTLKIAKDFLAKYFSAGEGSMETPEEEVLKRIAQDLENRIDELCDVLNAKPGPSSWELERAKVAGAIARLSAEGQSKLWKALTSRGGARLLVEGLLDTCASAIVEPLQDDEMLDPSYALKALMHPIPIQLKKLAGWKNGPEWPDNGGAAVEPMTKMSRLSDWMWQRIDSVADRKAAAPPSDSGSSGGGDEDGGDHDSVEDEISGMDEVEFREHMAGRMSDLANMEPEERVRAMERLKRSLAVFARLQGGLPSIDREDEEEAEASVPEEAKQLRAAADVARKKAELRRAEHQALVFRIEGSDLISHPDETLYAFLSRSLKRRGRTLWSAQPTVVYWSNDFKIEATEQQQQQKKNVTSDAEQALSILYNCNKKEPLAGLSFVSSRLASAMQAALVDPLMCASGALPTWMTRVAESSSWLLPFALRRELMEKTSFGVLRSLSELRILDSGRNYSFDANQVFQFGRMPRAKIRVSRNGLLETARSAMKIYGGSRSQLEVEFFGEVGVGLGPTLEFWTLVSRELQTRRLHLFLDKDATGEGVFCDPTGPGGLFPHPVKAGGVVSADWDLAGTLVAKAMLDGRLLDLPLSPVFWDLVCGNPIGLDALKEVYPEAYVVLAELQRIRLLRDSGCKDAEKLKYNGQCSVNDLSMSMTLIGHDDWELVPGGCNLDLTMDNIHQYVDATLDYLLGKGVALIRDAFRQGMARVFPWERLRLLTAAEIDMCVCGDAGDNEEMWSVENLRRYCKLDHGYDAGSRVISVLFEVLSKRFNAEDRKQFLRFITGTPRLPIGGFAQLQPRLTIVEKTMPERHPDEVLPSVMTCVNFLKLPNYSSIDVLEQRLRVAMTETSGFHFS